MASPTASGDLWFSSTRTVITSIARCRKHHPTNTSCTVSSQAHVRCGVWSFINGELVFVPHFVDPRRGRVLFGHRQLALLYEDSNSLDSGSAYRININYFDIGTATTGGYKCPTVTFALHISPTLYSKPSGELAAALASLSIVNGLKLPPLKKMRVTSINQAHSDVVGTCFVYQIQLAHRTQLLCRLDCVCSAPPARRLEAALSDGDTLENVALEPQLQELSLIQHLTLPTSQWLAYICATDVCPHLALGTNYKARTCGGLLAHACPNHFGETNPALIKARAFRVWHRFERVLQK
ncbi:uncharacterized protein M437DRAFT_65921 [Aureobasidium melanogenum CBS 110374]|uniref:RdRP-like PH domain-containing protein n=1 Tax=Aureobasidium melanogenum (strain CBS 110374) TaxID=1043003 RepID=A0A074VPL0_AURM1|nr:uncharacterized protein M437DRAFT_65921 [Aureobasidium melanogenum CBS 110374]KEQ62655.1 hypothetical protein M437DRAFT_65921 [Aureobasidium melanogenum CBS 110374]